MLNETLKPLAELPDVSFIDNDTIDAMMQRLVSNYERRYQEITGKEVTLGAADPMSAPRAGATEAEAESSKRRQQGTS